MPVVELTTTGRKSGQQRTVLLTSPVQEGGTIVLVASRGGDDHHPAWYLNLCAHPRVTVSVKGGPTEVMIARTASADERARWWPDVVKAYRGYASYQKKTSREIPLVVLTRAE
jgi:deazaflavin-dependent oxidoreductase (nitroreductase family)